MSNTINEDDSAPAYPIPISRLGHRYYLYDIAHITHLRITHHILGTLVGSLPQSPQQNLFLGLPLELTPEEARLLVSKGVCCIVDDVSAHRNGLQNLTLEERRIHKNLLQAQGHEAAAQAARRAGYKTESALSRLDEKRREKALKTLGRNKGLQAESVNGDAGSATEPNESTEADSLFSPSTPAPIAPGSLASTSTPPQLQAHGITPTTSYPPLPLLSTSASATTTKTKKPFPAQVSASPLPNTFNAAALPHFLPTPPPSPSPETTTSAPPSPLPSPRQQQQQQTTPLPPAPPSYPLFAHLHSLSYFMSPGLRFGCQYCVYPGDPLRFHSHFLAVGAAWDEEIDLLTLVGGGRLGTGVKKGFLLGGVERKGGIGVGAGEMDEGEGGGELGAGDADAEGVRCFCVEWGGM